MKNQEEILQERLQGVPISDRDYFYEDELPEGYPIDRMFPYSWVDGVRLFPMNIPWEAHQAAVREEVLKTLNAFREYIIPPQVPDDEGKPFRLGSMTVIDEEGEEIPLDDWFDDFINSYQHSGGGDE